jgi:hypothetical protein
MAFFKPKPSKFFGLVSSHLPILLKEAEMLRDVGVGVVHKED